MTLFVSKLLRIRCFSFISVSPYNVIIERLTVIRVLPGGLGHLPQISHSQVYFFPGTSSTTDRTDEGEELWAKWNYIVTNWEDQWKKQNVQIRELVRRGIPLHFRAIVWQLLCSAAEAPEKKLYAEYIKVMGDLHDWLFGANCGHSRQNRPAKKWFAGTLLELIPSTTSSKRRMDWDKNLFLT